MGTLRGKTSDNKANSYSWVGDIMRITVDLPDWCDERHIYIMAGVELVAYKWYGQDFVRVKKVRCTFCGDCCKGLNDLWPYGVDDAGTCIHLQEESATGEFKCLLPAVPSSCIMGSQEKGKYENTNCVVEYEDIPV